MFEQFLKINNAYTAYLTEFIELDRSAGFFEWLITRRPNRYLSSAFNWARSQQGYAYWDALDNKWQNKLKS